MKKINYLLPLLFLFVTSVLLQAFANDNSKVPTQSLESETTASIQTWKIITPKNINQIISLHLGEKLGVLFDAEELSTDYRDVTISDRNILTEAVESSPGHFACQNRILDLYESKNLGPVTITYLCHSAGSRHKRKITFTIEVVE